MDARERIADHEEGLRATIEDYLANHWVALPAIVQSFNAAKNSCVVQPSIKFRQKMSDGTFRFVNAPLIQDVPVKWPGGGGWVITFPLAQGDEVLLHFASRCIDTWWQQGGIQVPSEIRIQDYSDAFAEPRIFSMPNVPTNISPTTTQLRSLDGTAYLELAAGGVVNIKAPGGVNVTGTLGASGEVTAKVGAGNHTVSAHIHPGVTTGGGTTGTPTG